MARNIIEYESALAKHAVLSHRQTDGLVLVVKHGNIWVTEESGEDVLLGTGSRYQSDGKGLLVIEALRDSTLQWQQQAPGLLARVMPWRKSTQIPAAVCHPDCPPDCLFA